MPSTARGSHTVIRPKRSVRGAAATIALTSGISVVAPAVIGAVAHAANTQTMYATTDVNVRSASSNSGKVLTIAARGQSVQVTGKKVRGWVPVTVNGTTGWIYQRFLTEENTLPVHFGSDPLPDTMIATVPVNVRDDSRNAGNVLTAAERGQEVQVTGRPDGSWVPVSVNGKSGWIYGRYLTTGKAAPAPAKPSTDAKGDSSTSREKARPALDNAATHTTDGLNLRASASSTSAIIDHLTKNQGVTVTGKTNGNWIQVHANGKTGWLYRTYLTGKIPTPKTQTPTKHHNNTSRDNAATHTTDGLNLRASASSTSAIIDHLTKNQGVTVTGKTNGNWIQVHANGKTGWLYRTYLTGKIPTPKTQTPAKHHNNTSREKARPSKGSSGVGGRCIASFYDEPQSTASGEQFDPSAITAAHKSLPLGTHIRVTNVRNGRSVVVRINDRGPYVAGRCVDLSRASFARIADLGQGTTPITYTVLD
ncbi:septal ring lytic transglycosylase RlpA family protein [Cutibacterium sp. V947]|uniref:septal ring lytic transglycosylase RlpA family protein n=1 Tax=Cutibacterium sp. V947 TaxID=3446480 RepID=UPI003EE0D8AD